MFDCEENPFEVKSLIVDVYVKKIKKKCLKIKISKKE